MLNHLGRKKPDLNLRNLPLTLCPVQHEVCTPVKVSGSCSRVDPWLGFKLVGDNLDRRVKPRHQTMDKRGTGFHAFQYIAIKDRVDLSNFSDKHDKPVCLSEEVDANGVLPSQDDVMIFFASLLQEFLLNIYQTFSHSQNFYHVRFPTSTVHKCGKYQKW